MSDGSLRGALAVLAAAGTAVAGYVLWSRWSEDGLLCSTGGCETVQSSEYAVLLGAPVAALGLVAYALIGILVFRRGPAARAAVAAIALAALAFSAYLLVVQIVVVDALCNWCIANDVVASLLAVFALLRVRGRDGATGIPAGSPALRRR